MTLPAFLILFPLLTAFILLFLKNNVARVFIVWSSFAVLCAASITLAVRYVSSDMQFIQVHSVAADQIIFWAEVLLSAYVLYTAFKHKQKLVPLFVLVQALPLIWFEFKGPHIEISNTFVIDRLSVVMALIIGIIGGIICVYSLGYMRDFHDHFHSEVKDRRPFFFFILFAFLSAMFGIVLSNNLRWLYFFWEVTTSSTARHHTVSR
jgi:ech hydrogenase subunit A